MSCYTDIRRVHLEISSRCNAACPDCPRNLRGIDIEEFNIFPVCEFSLEDIKKIFSKTFLQQLQSILINGNHGDFVTCREALDVVRYFRDSNPNLIISITTNGSGQPKIWKALGALPNVKIIFSIDGLEDTNHLYRQYTNFNLIINNAKSFIDAGGQAFWKMVEFDFNEHQRQSAKDMAERLGFVEFYTVNHGRDNMVVFDRKGNYTHTIGQPNQPVYDGKIALERFADGFKNPDYLMMYRDAPSKSIKCRALDKTQKFDSIYVQSNGQVYPCCWIGCAPDTMLSVPGTDQIRKICYDNNALEVGLERAVEWFVEIKKSWTIREISQGRLFICNETCSDGNYLF